MNAAKLVERARLAAEIADLAEDVVRAAEEALAAAEGPTARDIAETRLGEAYAEQDAALETVGPVIEQRRQQVVRAGWEAIRSLQGEPGSSWDAKHRKFHSAATKAWLVRKFGRRVYEGKFPW